MVTNLDTRLVDLVGTDLDKPPTTPSAPFVPPGAAAAVVAARHEFEPTGQQGDAIDKIHDWYRAPFAGQVFRLFGYAGTGKTTIARHIVEQLGVRALYAAYTGKAAYVLRGKGCADASTIHSLIYQPVEKARQHLNELRDQLAETWDPDEQRELRARIAREQAKLESPDWILQEDSELDGAPLLVLDEVSMVGERIAHDLMSFGTRILCLGDPAQLPPVDGGGYFINAAPDHLLTEVQRSALDSPVLRMATAIRSSEPGAAGYGVLGRDGDSGRVDRLSIGDLLAFDQVLVGRNATRWQACHLIRALRGFTAPHPVAGDRIMALANSSMCNVFNGQQFDVLEHRPDPTGREDRHHLTVRDDDGDVRMLTVWAAGFRDLEGEKQVKRVGRGDIAAATWAQAITTHKSQGSEWPSVLVVDEAGVFHNAAYREHAKVAGHAVAAIEGHVNGRRWLYTAVTRASERVVIVPQLNGVITG